MFAPKSGEATTRETVGSDPCRAPEAWCSQTGRLQAQTAEDWCSQRGPLQTQVLNEATDGLARLVLDSFSGAIRTASYELPPVSEEDPRRETAGSGSHHAPEAWCSHKETLQAHRAEDWCSMKGTLQTQVSNEATKGLAPSVFDHFSGAVRADSWVFPPTSEEDPSRETVGSDSRRAPEAWCSRKETLQIQSAEAWCSRTGTLQAGNSNTVFDPSLEYSTYKIFLFWQPPSYFSPWSFRRLLWTTCHIIVRSSI